jgi:hypothetical protein
MFVGDACAHLEPNQLRIKWRKVIFCETKPLRGIAEEGRLGSVIDGIQLASEIAVQAVGKRVH